MLGLQSWQIRTFDGRPDLVDGNFQVHECVVDRLAKVGVAWGLRFTFKPRVGKQVINSLLHPPGGIAHKGDPTVGLCVDLACVLCFEQLTETSYGT